MATVELVELGALTAQDWADLVADEPEPFGPVGAGLKWRPKDRHVALRLDDGRLVAVAGAVVAEVAVADVSAFDVVGIGGVIVTRPQRGQGLLERLMDPLLRLASELGPDHAMLFCRPDLVALYRRFDFAEIAAPVWAEQPAGRIEVPLAAMWRPLRAGAAWPPGRVDVPGLPF